ncbi:MAG: hypothetical protein CMJ81_11835 [Planctomycetaceae bacterium]|nr:hypothetical protein [Planctomycetaceae bacterium]MBP60650.1 hypothetical protein [Planctomycetaceae bacterium]
MPQVAALPESQIAASGEGREMSRSNLLPVRKSGIPFVVVTGFSISQTRASIAHGLGSCLVHNRHEDQHWCERCNLTLGHLFPAENKTRPEIYPPGNFLARLDATGIIERVDLPGGSHSGLQFRRSVFGRTTGRQIRSEMWMHQVVRIG